MAVPAGQSASGFINIISSVLRFKGECKKVEAKAHLSGDYLMTSEERLWRDVIWAQVDGRPNDALNKLDVS